MPERDWEKDWKLHQTGHDHPTCRAMAQGPHLERANAGREI